jgi:hypothetical protein
MRARARGGISPATQSHCVRMSITTARVGRARVDEQGRDCRVRPDSAGAGLVSRISRAPDRTALQWSAPPGMQMDVCVIRLFAARTGAAASRADTVRGITGGVLPLGLAQSSQEVSRYRREVCLLRRVRVMRPEISLLVELLPPPSMTVGRRVNRASHSVNEEPKAQRGTAAQEKAVKRFRVRLFRGMAQGARRGRAPCQ